MAKRILVPLDQSAIAESVLPLVEDLGRGGALVRLLHVAEEPANWVDPDGRVLAYADQEMERLEGEGLDYLRAMEAHLGDTQVECVVRFGDPLEAILREAEALRADMIVVTTAGRSGLGRSLLGSVAERVVRKARASVLLLRPTLAGLV